MNTTDSFNLVFKLILPSKNSLGTIKKVAIINYLYVIGSKNSSQVSVTIQIVGMKRRLVQISDLKSQIHHPGFMAISLFFFF